MSTTEQDRESKFEAVSTQAKRYLKAAYGPDYVYRAPETFENLVERWIWAIAADVPELAEESIAKIERVVEENREAPAAAETQAGGTS